MVSDKFRRQLRQEAERWRTEGLVSSDQFQQIAQRYQFDALDLMARDRFVAILIGLGSVLLGLGVITFVAANWQDIPRLVRMLLLLGLLIGVNAAGFYLWRLPSTPITEWRSRLGQGLLLLGGLILGANLALMGQLFHIDGSTYALVLTWGFGVLLMAFGLRLNSLGVLATGLIGVGYWMAKAETYSLRLPFPWQWVIDLMPVIALVLLIGLAYWCRSRIIFGLATLLIIGSFEGSLSHQDGWLESAPGIAAAIATTLPAALLWSYRDRLAAGLMRSVPEAERPDFQYLARLLSMVYLVGLTYIFSFHWAWYSRTIVPLSKQLQFVFSSGLTSLASISVLVLVVLTVVQWVLLLRSERYQGRWRLHALDGMVLVGLGVIALLFFWHPTIASIQVTATYLMNVLLFLLASALLRDGISQGNRLSFWGGMVLLALQILSRMLEYDTGLLLKSLAFVLCGIGVIAIGLWFERYVRSLNPAPTSEEPS